MANRTYILYMHRNKINNKVYIGITSQIPEKRWHYGLGYKQNPAFWNAIQKYGWNNFEHIILQEGLNREDAENIEIETIKQYNSNDSDFGYNISKGGYSGSDNKAKPVLCIELGLVFDIIYDAIDYFKNELNITLSRGSIQQVCLHKKNKHTAGGYHWIYLDEFLNKYGQINNVNLQRAIIEEDEKYKRYSVQCIETGDTFKDCKEVEILTGISTVNDCILGNIKSAGTLHWLKVPYSETNDIKDIAYYKNKSIKKKIRNIELNIIYNSVRDAARIYNTTSGNICACAKGYSKSACGYHWEYVY